MTGLFPVSEHPLNRPAGAWPSPDAHGSVFRVIATTALDYLALMKPRIILLLLITTSTTMIVASPHHVAFKTLVFTLLGGALAAGSANAHVPGSRY